MIDDVASYTGQMRKFFNPKTEKEIMVQHGNGVLTWKDGSVFDGDWRNGSAEGKGKFSHPNGDVYKGDF